MTKTFFGVIALLAMAVSLHGNEPLDTARKLYLAAAYEEALLTLDQLPSNVDADQADKVRALCLLALNRSDEATRALETLAIRRPLLKLDGSESPKLVRMFQQARERVLVPAAKALYGAAKGSFQAGQLATAQQQFGDLLILLREPELSSQPDIADLRMLAEGFSNLVEQRTAAARAATAAPVAAAAASKPAIADGSTHETPAALAQAPAAPERPVAVAVTPPAVNPPVAATPPAASAPLAAQTPAPPAPSAAAPQPGAGAIFTADDSGVVAPVPVEQQMPPWVAPPGLRRESFSGLLEVVIDETGRVTSSAVLRSVNSTYDRRLLQASKRWQYRPALRDGRPVRFRRVLLVVLSPGPA